MSPSGREATFPLPRGAGTYAAVARRTELDAALLDVVKAAGVRVLEGHAVTGAEERLDRVVLDVEGIGTVQARYAIAADGMWSPMRKHLGLATPGYLGEWHAFRQYFTDVGPRAAQDLFVWFEPDLLPGYAWSFPLPDGGANVGFGIQRRDEEREGKVTKVQDMKDVWPDLLARPHIREVLGPDATPESPHKAWPIPARIDDIVLTAQRTLFVGDAAAATDPMTGEGIGQALLTGILAARGHRGRRHRRRPASPPSTAARPSPPSRPTTRCRCSSSGPCSTARAPGPPSASPAPPPGPAATSPAGSSRTTPGPSLVTPRRWRRRMFTRPRRLPRLRRALHCRATTPKQAIRRLTLVSRAPTSTGATSWRQSWHTRRCRQDLRPAPLTLPPEVRGPRPARSGDLTGRSRRPRERRMRTRLTDVLQIEHPVMLAGMGGVSYSTARRRRERGRRLRHAWARRRCSASRWSTRSPRSGAHRASRSASTCSPPSRAR